MVILKSYILCDYLYITFLKCQNFINEECISDSQGLGSTWGGEREVGIPQ